MVASKNLTSRKIDVEIISEKIAKIVKGCHKRHLTIFIFHFVNLNCIETFQKIFKQCLNQHTGHLVLNLKYIFFVKCGL